MEGRCFENNLNYQYDEIFLHRTISKTISYLWNEVLKHSDLPDSNCLYDGKAGELYWLTQLSSSLSAFETGRGNEAALLVGLMRGL